MMAIVKEMVKVLMARSDGDSGGDGHSVDGKE